VLGTPAYLAPEQVLGQPATPLSDVYALGVVAYECLAGRRPFEGENAFGVAVRRLQESPAALGPDVPDSVERVVAGALAREPRDRWQSAADLAAAARSAASGLTGTTVDGRGRRSRIRAVGDLGKRAVEGPTARRRRRTVLLVSAAVLLVLSGVAVWATTRGALERNRQTFVPKDFAPCGPVLCPTEPMCWGGLVALGAAPSHRARLTAQGRITGRRTRRRACRLTPSMYVRTSCSRPGPTSRLSAHQSGWPNAAKIPRPPPISGVNRGRSSWMAVPGCFTV
jgi:serine/threonine-protein kinase